MNPARFDFGSAAACVRSCLLTLVVLVAPTVVAAAPSQFAGSGVWDVPTAESKRAGHLGLGFFGTYRNLGLRDSLDTHLNHLTLGGAAIFGIPGGFEVSGTLPIHGYYTSTDKGSSPFDEDFKLRLGDLSGRLRWTTPLFIPGMRWGWEGEVTFPTGTDDELTFPARGTVRPFTSGKNNYVARSMLTWDGRGAGRSLALRLHAGAGYHFQGDEGRYYNSNATLPLDLPTPTDKKQNDFLSLFTAAELDLARVTLFGELTSDQYVNQRDLMRSNENRITLTPGIRFWLPGGVSLAGAYSMNLATDDAATAFNPDLAYSDHQLRVALSLGTIYRNKRAVREEAEAPMPMPAPAETPAIVDEAALEKAKKDAEIRARHETQNEKLVEPKLAAPAPMAEELAPMAPAAPVAPRPTAAPAPAVAPAPASAPPAAPRTAPAAPRYIDTDGDGIPDAQDQCPLMAEDWDGFQDLDGCPDLDNDRDGIPDIRDQCPNDPETYNGYYDFDGCPDELPGPRNSVGAVMAPAPAPRAAAPPVAPAPLNASREAEDALRRALATEQARSADLSDRLARLQQQQLAAPAPLAGRDDTLGPTTARDMQLMMTLEAERRRGDELEARLRAVESATRNPTIIERPAPTAAPAPVVVQPGTASMSKEDAARLRALETELATLRARNSARDAMLAAPIPAPAPAVATADSASPQILSRLSTLQSSVDSLAAAQNEASAAVPVADAGKALDLMLPPGSARVFPEVQFESGSVRLEGGARSTLEMMAQVLRLVPDARVQIVGHTDNVGRAAANRALSRGRAQAVADALLLRGVNPAQLTVLGRGETMPIASNGTAAGRQANRRVEFVRSR